MRRRFAVDLVDEDVGDDVLRAVAHKGPARLRLQLHDQLVRLDDLFHLDLLPPRDALQILVFEELQVLVDDAVAEMRFQPKGAKLDFQALLQVPRANPGGVELLQVPQHAF